MTDFEKVLMSRDGMSKQQAATEKQNASVRIAQIMAAGGGYGEVEEMLLEDYGLEMDYIMDLIM